jgi:hypothetical protein
MVSSAKPDHPVGSMNMKGNEVEPPSCTNFKMSWMAFSSSLFFVSIMTSSILSANCLSLA